MNSELATNGQVLRQWAREQGLEMSDRGAVPRRVREAFIRENAGQPADVIASVHNGAERQITILCPLCSHLHQHGAKFGERGDLGYKVKHCWDVPHRDATRDGYRVVDDTPVERWETSFAPDQLLDFLDKCQKCAEWGLAERLGEGLYVPDSARWLDEDHVRAQYSCAHKHGWLVRWDVNA